MKRTCDGTDPSLIKMVDDSGAPVADGLLAAEYVPCDCAAMFDDVYHSVIWPHDYLPPARPDVVIADLPNLMGIF